MRRILHEVEENQRNPPTTNVKTTTTNEPSVSSHDEDHPSHRQNLTSTTLFSSKVEETMSESKSAVNDDSLPEGKEGAMHQDQQVLEIMIEMLPFDSLTLRLWEGLVTSCGGMTLSIVSTVF